ncbi:serine hydrolase domain-containing protein (plasmid) [Streptomyces sp. BI20]|uniref:serine hydrolase domain-containing protein n=1 Tax=Streptomyces sp. BI20 TaxID=3403460 RepID=UPI003C73E3BB
MGEGLRAVLEARVADGSVPGAVALVAVGDRVEVAAAGTASVPDGTPMARDSIFRIASLTKPVTAVATLLLVTEGALAPEDPVARWLPELAEPVVVRTPGSEVTDTVPAVRPVTVADLLEFRAGWGFPEDFSLPAVAPLFSELRQGPPSPHAVPEPDAWLRALARIPMLAQPGERWLYNTCSDVLGVLVARASGRGLPEFLAERVFGPLGMSDTGFFVPAADRGRFTSYHRLGPDGERVLADGPDGDWSRPPAFPSGAGGLVSTVDDLAAFGRMVLSGGAVPGGGRLLPAELVRAMVSDRLTAGQRAAAELFLDGQGWGWGGSVDVVARDPWNVPGRFGWVGGTGTAWHVVPSAGRVEVLLTQQELTGPTPLPPVMRGFWEYAAGR